MKYGIQFCKAGESDVPGPEVYWMRNWDTWETLNFIIVVVRGGGKTIGITPALLPISLG